MKRPNDLAAAIRAVAAEQAGRLIAIRRDIHAHPELAFEERRTSDIVAAELARLSIPHRTGVGGTGVIGWIEGGRPGPTLAIRADMDALPIEEANDLPYKSTVPGKMHACGHDGHTTMLLAAGVGDVAVCDRQGVVHVGREDLTEVNDMTSRTRERADDVAQALEDAGLPLDERLQEEDWVALIGHKA